jgi:hypothetical protein
LDPAPRITSRIRATPTLYYPFLLFLGLNKLYLALQTEDRWHGGLLGDREAVQRVPLIAQSGTLHIIILCQSHPNIILPIVEREMEYQVHTKVPRKEVPQTERIGGGGEKDKAC